MSEDPAQLVLLDLGLPGEDGLSIARELRQVGRCGLIIITGRGEATDKVVGLELGHGRRGIGRVLTGSDAEQILRTASVPVLLVRAAEVVKVPLGARAGNVANLTNTSSRLAQPV